MIENEFYRLTVSPRGAITSFVDKRLGNREFAGTTGGYAINDLGAATRLAGRSRTPDRSR